MLSIWHVACIVSHVPNTRDYIYPSFPPLNFITRISKQIQIHNKKQLKVKIHTFIPHFIHKKSKRLILCESSSLFHTRNQNQNGWKNRIKLPTRLWSLRRLRLRGPLQILRRRRPSQKDRDSCKCQCTYHHGGDRLRRAGIGMGDCAAGLGRRTHRPLSLFLRNLLLLLSSRVVLSHRRPRHRKTKLYIQWSCQSESWYTNRLKPVNYCFKTKFWI